MICCCSNIYKVKRPLYTCAGATFLLPYTRLVAGAVYTFITDFLATVVEIQITADEDGAVTLPTENFNEDYQYIGCLFGVGDDKIPFTVGEAFYDCIAFTTKQVVVKIAQNITKPTIVLTDPEGNILTDPEGNILTGPTNI